MKLSKRNGRNQTGFVVLLLALTLAGCSQRESLPTSVETVSADQHLPFEGTSDKAGNFPTGSLTPTSIPAGTPVTIHLQLSLSSASSRPGDPFDAVLDEPIMVRGQTIAPRGAVLVGKVLDAKPADQFQEPGYLRLALTEISHEQRNVTILRDGSGKKGALIGASIDAPGTTFATGSMDVGVAPERRLTFRLAQSLPL
jgi:hypothetical protein